MKVIITNRQEVIETTQEEKTKIKDYLTYDNPAYKNAKRYSRYRYTSIPPYLTYYEEKSVRVGEGERKKALYIPNGVRLTDVLEDPQIDLEDMRNVETVNYPPFLLELRKDQKKAERAYLSQIDETYPRQIIQMPTGKGKTILALHIAYTLKQKTLILVHKDDLVVGWKEDIKQCFGGKLKCGLVKAKSRVVGDQLTIATFQTLNRMSEEELSEYTSQFGLVIHDEVHHCGLNIFNVVDKFNSRYRLGLSATPTRTDGLNFVFDIFFGGLCYKHEVTEDDEDISQVEVRVLDSPFKYKPFIYKGEVFNYYDFSPKELPDDIDFVEEMDYQSRPKIPYLTIDNEAVKSELTMRMVCTKIIEEYNAGHSIIALFTQKEHINMYREYLGQFIPDDQILLYYGDSKEDSAEMMKKAEDRECLVTLATYAKATEGTNVKSWEVEFLVSSLNNEKNVEQATGRIRRKKDGKLNPVIVYDVYYSGCYSLRSHFRTRYSAYSRLKYKINNSDVSVKRKTSMFKRGYH